MLRSPRFPTPAAVAALLVLAGSADEAPAQEPRAGAVRDAAALRGVLRDAVTGAPVPGASVAVDGGEARTLSDDEGAFVLERVPSGPWLLRVEHFAYEPGLVPLTGVAADDPLEVRLRPSPLGIEGLDVTGSRELSVAGVVLDARSGAGLPWADVRLGEARRVPADARGAFRVGDVSPGQYLLFAERLGYTPAYVPVDLTRPLDPVVLRLEPDPVLLEGLTVMTSRLETRRRAYALGPVRAYDETSLRRSAAPDMLHFLRADAALPFTACRGSRVMDGCVQIRGAPVRPKVFVDELLMPCGLAMLHSFRPEELYAVEVYDRGRQIRVYSTGYMETRARGPRTLIPADLSPPELSTGC